MKGTVHKDNWYFYHNALSLMTAKSTMSWICEMWYKARWLVPKNDLNIGTRFHRKPVGNRLEFMPLDNSLNANIKRAHNHHVAVTLNLPMDEDRKFYNCKPRLISRGIKKLVESTSTSFPSSKGIINDCDNAFDAMWTIYKA